VHEAPKNESFHIPVLAREVIQFLITDPSGLYVDSTIGGGGHAEEILRSLNKRGRVVGIDWDEDAVSFCKRRFSSYGDRIRVIKGDFANIDQHLQSFGVSKINGLFLDLGLSTHQILTAERGFSYLKDGPLDMRMHSSASKCAADVINTYSEKDLADMFYCYGEERFSRRIARRIVKERKNGAIQSTGALASLVRKITPPKYHIKTLARIWQSVRFEINGELKQLRVGLERSYSMLDSGSVIVILCYESLMDRMVKRFFQGNEPSFAKNENPIQNQGYNFQILTRRVVRPSEQEVISNPKSSSAKLRAAKIQF